jgi:transposase
MRFMVVDGKVGVRQFIEFLARLIDHAGTKIFLIVDGHPAHKAKAVQRYVESEENRLRLFFLPADSPELNPDERVWNDLKNNRLGRTVIEDKPSLQSAIIGFMRSIQKDASLGRFGLLDK